MQKSLLKQASQLSILHPVKKQERETSVWTTDKTSSSGADWKVGEGIGVREGLWFGKRHLMSCEAFS